MRYESVMKLRGELDKLGKLKGLTQDENGTCIITCVVVGISASIYIVPVPSLHKFV